MAHKQSTNVEKHITRWWQLKHVLFSPLPREMIHLDNHIFQMGWFNYQLEFTFSCFIMKDVMSQEESL